MSDADYSTYFDELMKRSLSEYGKKVKKYELIQILKRYIPCSELEVEQSLDRLIRSGEIRKTKADEYLLTYS